MRIAIGNFYLLKWFFSTYTFFLVKISICIFNISNISSCLVMCNY